MSEDRVLINRDICKGCGLCTLVCPKKILQIDTKSVNRKGYNPVICIDQEQCISCANCATTCPDLVYQIRKP